MERSRALAFSFGLSFGSALALLACLAAAGCGPPPLPAALVYLGDSKAGSAGAAEVRRVRIPDGGLEASIPLGASCADLARGPAGELYAASGREVLTITAGGALPLTRLDGKLDSVLPSRDGGRLYLLEHPAEADAPHRLRAWDLRAARFSGETVLDPLAYEIHEGPGLVLATHLQGRRVEVVRIAPDSLELQPAERLEPPAADGSGPRDFLRSAAVEPGAGWALLVESGLDGRPEKSRLWTLELPAGRWRPHPLAASGFFQHGVTFLAPGPRGESRAAVCGGDRLLLISGGPADGFREDGLLELPGVFHDARRLAVQVGPVQIGLAPGPPASPGAAGAPAEVLLLAGTDAGRRRGFLSAVDPARARLLWTWSLDAPADLLEVK